MAEPTPTAEVSREPSRQGLLFGAFAIFFLAFVMSGNANAIPQMFFQRFYPQRKNLLLSITLLMATVAGTLGVSLSRRFRLSTVRLLTAMLTTVIITLILYSTGRVPLFIGAMVLVQFAVFYLTNLLDYASVARAGTLRGFNDAAGVIGRLFGTLSAPAFFPTFYDDKVIALSCSGFLGLLAIMGAGKLLRMPALLHGADATGEDLEKSPDRTDQIFFAFVVSIYVSLVLFGANMIYLLRDRLHIAYPETRGGMAIAAMFVCAILFNSLIALVHRGRAEFLNREIRIGPLALPAVILGIFGAVITVGMPITYGLFLSGACLLGAAYGVFVWEVRDYTSRGAQHEGKSALVTWFNNIGNVSALIAFGLMLTFAANHAAAPASYYLKITGAIGCTPMLGLLLLFAASVLLRSQTRVPPDVAEQPGS